MVRIQINGEEREFAQASLTVADLIEQLSLTPQRIAIEVNRQIIPRTAWEQTVLKDGDRAEIVHFVGGGVTSPTNRGPHAGSPRGVVDREGHLALPHSKV